MILSNTIRFHRGTDSARDRFIAIFESMFDDGHDDLSYASIVPDWNGEIPDAEFYDKYIGARGTVVAVDLRTNSVHFSSDHDPILNFFTLLGNQIADIDENAVLTLSTSNEDNYLYIDSEVVNLRNQNA